MERNQIENLYKINGLNDYKLKTHEDLIRVHGIDYRAIDGYARLDDINKALYSKFIINIFNAWGLMARAALIPKGIYFVEHIEHLSKDDPAEDYYTVIGATINSIDKNGLKSVLRHYIFEGYENLEILKDEVSNYLRFEYELDGCKEWLHVIKEDDWY